MKKGQGFAKKITAKTLEIFRPLLQEKSDHGETTKLKNKNEDHIDTALADIESRFQGKSFTVSVPFTHSKTTKTTKKRPKGKIVSTLPYKKSLSEKRGEKAWEKIELPPSDVQRQKGHPIGGIRLTQANYRSQGKIIDQTTYFRKEVFVDQDWRIIKNTPFEEKAPIKFDVTILGDSYGTHTLDVLHKPSGEAGQGNYTTILTWKHLGDLIYKLNLVGRKFKLYKPIEGKKEPFFIEIS